ncbi:MAG: SRPBCC family protein [Myxococcales bacterium]|nr:SRPBCC family protein [Myxococcales bacterium]
MAKHTRGVTTFTTPSDTEIVATRAFAAPRSLVWDCHTSPEHIPNWMLGPDGWTMPVCEVDLRVGGKWRFVWRKGAGEEMEMTGEYREVAPTSRLVNTEAWGGDWPVTVNTTALAEEGGLTLLTATVTYPDRAARDRAMGTGMESGWDTSNNRLDAYLEELARRGDGRGDGKAHPPTVFTRKDDTTLVATRSFAAPRALVWDCWTKPEHVSQWLLGFAGWTMPVCEIDLRPGGKWRYVWKGPAGEEMFTGGVVMEVVSPEKLVQTEQWGGEGPESVQTLVLTEGGGQTHTTSTVVYPSKEVLDMVLGTGMEKGWAQSHDFLEDYLSTQGR